MTTTVVTVQLEPSGVPGTPHRCCVSVTTPRPTRMREELVVARDCLTDEIAKLDRETAHSLRAERIQAS